MLKQINFLAMNGDCFCVIDYNHLIAFIKNKSQSNLGGDPDARCP